MGVDPVLALALALALARPKHAHPGSTLVRSVDLQVAGAAGAAGPEREAGAAAGAAAAEEQVVQAYRQHLVVFPDLLGSRTCCSSTARRFQSTLELEGTESTPKQRHLPRPLRLLALELELEGEEVAAVEVAYPRYQRTSLAGFVRPP